VEKETLVHFDMSQHDDIVDLYLGQLL